MEGGRGEGAERVWSKSVPVAFCMNDDNGEQITTDKSQNLMSLYGHMTDLRPAAPRRLEPK